MAYTITVKPGGHFFIGDMKVALGSIYSDKDFDLIVNDGGAYAVGPNGWTVLGKDIQVQATNGPVVTSNVIRVRIDAPYSRITRVKVCEVCKGSGTVRVADEIVKCPECEVNQ